MELKKQLPMINKERNFRVVGSRSHLSLETENYIDKLKKKKEKLRLSLWEALLKYV